MVRRTSAALQDWYGHDEAVLAAQIHDLGKYTEAFQKRLRGEEKGLDHWSSGTLVALRRYQSMAAALAVYGHHVGIPPMLDIRGNNKTLQDLAGNLRPSGLDWEGQLAALQQDGISPTQPNPRILTPENLKAFGNVGWQLDTRRLFSALVDADFLDTEEHFQDAARPQGRALTAESDLLSLLDYQREIVGRSQAPEKVLKVRQQVFDACLKAAEVSPGVFTLTSPTGAGKTLAMLAFALRHAVCHGLRRIITVLPFLTLTEQTAKIYRTILADQELLVEHHSLAERGFEPPQHQDGQGPGWSRIRQLTENWDAPYVLTTNVQFFESLFSNRPGKCRKLHRIAGSIILLDEVQTLPKKLAIYTLAALSHLCHGWGCSVVLATATQPAFERLSEQVQKVYSPGWNTRPIVADPSAHFLDMKRNTYELRDPERPQTMAEIADEIMGMEAVLVVVNLKRQARQLWESISSRREHCYHLSTSMCPSHRRATLEQVRLRLAQGLPAVLVSTQCIEAGVDLDFPRLYRAYGPWDALVQAAGRCNREGKAENGVVTVFCPQGESFPDGIYRQATEVTRSITRGQKQVNLDDPELVRRYFEFLYQVSSLETPELKNAIDSSNFPRVADEYRLIRDDCINVVVPYPPELDIYQQLLARRQHPNRRWFQSAREVCVSVFRPKQERPIWDHLLPIEREGKAIHDWFLYRTPEHYHPDLGLTPPEDFAELIF